MQLQLQTKERDISLVDARSIFELRRFLNEEDKNIIRPARAMWKEQSALITTKTAESALQTGRPIEEWTKPWERMIREFVRDDVVSQWVKSIRIAGDRMANRVNRIQRKAFDFDSTASRIKTWVDYKGGKLIADLTAAQMGSTQALLQHQIALGVTSPYILAQRLRPIVGLTYRETQAVTKFMETLIAEGLSSDTIRTQVNNYTNYLHKNRASRIARTEISNAYNYGQLESVLMADVEGWLPGTPEKYWMAGGTAPCEICSENEDAGPIPLNETFPSGHEHPTAHPQCECAVGYKVKRDGGGIVSERPPTKVPTRKRPPRRMKRGQAGHIDPELSGPFGPSQEFIDTWLKDTYLKSTGKKMSDEMALKFQSVIRNFTGENSADLRMAQLNMKKHFKSTAEFNKWLKNSDLLEDYLKFAPQFSPETTIYRGIKATKEPFNKVSEMVRKIETGEIKVGHKMTLDATSHWSSDLGSAQYWNGDIIFETKGVVQSSSIIHFSEVVSEAEVMVSKKVKYEIKKITSSEFAGKKTYRILLEAIE